MVLQDGNPDVNDICWANLTQSWSPISANGWPALNLENASASERLMHYCRLVYGGVVVASCPILSFSWSKPQCVMRKFMSIWKCSEIYSAFDVALFLVALWLRNESLTTPWTWRLNTISYGGNYSYKNFSP